jgi:hypothetical protein
VVALAVTLGIVVGSDHLARAGWLGQGLAAGSCSGGGAAQNGQVSAPPITAQHLHRSSTAPTRTAQEVATEQAGMNAQGQQGAPVGPIATVPQRSKRHVASASK